MSDRERYPHEPELSRLWAEFERSWAAHREQLSGRTGRDSAMSTRHDSLTALEAYTAALDARRLPIPPTVHRDLKLLRGLCSHGAMRWI